MILVTGVSGHVGGKALSALLGQGIAATGMVRSSLKGGELPLEIPARIANYDDLSSLLRAFEGVSTLLFVSSDGDARDVLRQHANVIDAAVSQSVSSIIFTSILDIDAASPFYYTPIYRDAERRLRESAAGWTILRCGLYSDFVLDHWIKPSFSTGVLSLPVGEGRIAPISREDIARAAAAVALSPMRHTGATYELTGLQALSFHELSKLAGAAFGRPLEFIPCSPADYLQRAWAELEAPWPHAFSTLCRSIAEGRYQRSTDAFERLLGRPAASFERFVQVTET
jgi:NAD(P)H dehydrogenase (quinone)